MSHTGGQRIELRAICAIAAVFALVFALLVSGAPHRLSSAAADGRAGDQIVRGVCHDALTDANVGTPGRPMKKGANCPCCLAAHSGPAVLPDRISAALRREVAAQPAVYRVFAAARPPFTLSQAVNGARAPPAGPLALS
ncbi:DUF2946 family protein [Methylosinus sporium]|uniref:DUF2946 domain-containing protein n=1 Tax=Methylosinus sporium TaxID=428 RepID=A0A2U1SVK7_METSR|nr:DUF2946 family protein [Methylosinus sporium]PWB95654.1 hypothetical protein C5689_00620 [Methylosinus sporium]